MNKSFLLLQGPSGVFFYSLAKRLKSKGHMVHKIHFNWGDRLFWKNSVIAADPFHARADKWERWFTNYITQRTITDIALYGDCRALHKKAIEIARANKITVHVFEEGYLRPNMVTLENDGVNANSPMLKSIKKTRDDINAYADKDIIQSDRNVGKPMRAQAWTTFIYYLAILCGGLFARQHNHRQFPPITEAYLWFTRFSMNEWRKYKSRQVYAEVERTKPSYFVFALQLSEDYQIREHSEFRSTAETIRTVMHSFAEFAPRDHMLIIKNHPLDNGKVNYGKIIRNIAEELSIEKRLLYVESGSLIHLLDNAAGLVCVNSTSGLQSIHRDIPTKILAPAIYNFSELVDTKPLDKFWKKPTRPQSEFYQNFRKYLLDKNQINGSFYSRKGLRIVIPKTVQKLTMKKSGLKDK